MKYPKKHPRPRRSFTREMIAWLEVTSIDAPEWLQDLPRRQFLIGLGVFRNIQARRWRS
jgi:hypothetical protein